MRADRNDHLLVQMEEDRSSDRPYFAEDVGDISYILCDLHYFSLCHLLLFVSCFFLGYLFTARLLLVRVSVETREFVCFSTNEGMKSAFAC